MTKQEMFDAVVEHMAVQRAPSVDLIGCCNYRGPNGRKCAAGVLLTDADLSRMQNTESIGRAYERGVLPKRFDAAATQFLEELQACHDEHTRHGDMTWLHHWKRDMLSLAQIEGLDDSKLRAVSA